MSPTQTRTRTRPNPNLDSDPTKPRPGPGTRPDQTWIQTRPNPDPDPDVSSCREYICCGRTSLFRLEADRNTLYLANRDVCSLSAGLEIASYTCDQELVVSSCDASSGSSSCWQAYDGVQTAWGTEGACTCVDARGRRVREGGGRGLFVKKWREEGTVRRGE